MRCVQGLSGEKTGFKVEQVSAVENMSLFYRFACFRSKSHKVFHESKARKEGYLLSPLGSVLQKVLMENFPEQFCAVFVLIARKS